MNARYSVFATVVSMMNLNPAYAWYGPFCYSDSVREITLTQPTIAGEAAGDLKVTFDDNQNHVKLQGVRASAVVKGAHEVLLIRDKSSSTGIFGIQLTSPRSSVGYKYELEFRKDPTECAGMIIKTSGDQAKPPKKAKVLKATSGKSGESRDASRSEVPPSVPAETVSPAAPAAAAPGDSPSETPGEGVAPAPAAPAVPE